MMNSFKLKVATITEQNGQKRKIISSFSTFRVRTQYAQKRAKLVFCLFTISQEKARALSEMYHSSFACQSIRPHLLQPFPLIPPTGTTSGFPSCRRTRMICRRTRSRGGATEAWSPSHGPSTRTRKRPFSPVTESPS